MLVAKPLAFLKRDLHLQSGYRFAFIAQIAGAILSITGYFFISQIFGGAVSPRLEGYGGDYFAFALVGIAIFSFVTISLNGPAGVIQTAQSMGALEAMFVTPTRFSTIVLSSSLWNYLMASANAFLYLALGSLVFRVNLQWQGLFSALLVLLLSITSHLGLGLMSAGFVLVMKRGNPLSWLFSITGGLLGGVIYPITVLPDWLRPLSYLLPVTYSLEATRAVLLKGQPLIALWPQLAVLSLFTCILLPSGIACFRYAVHRAKIDGSLTQY